MNLNIYSACTLQEEGFGVSLALGPINGRLKALWTSFWGT